MKTISIPYYTSTLDLHVDEANLKAVVTAKMHEYKAGKTEVELVHEALEHPIASPRLRDLAKGKQKVVLVTSDHTRAVPSKITLPILLDEIRQGNPDADITILIATGLHRPTTEEEQRRMFGDAIVDHEKSPSTTHLTRISSSTWACCPPVRTSTSTSWPLNVTCW